MNDISVTPPHSDFVVTTLLPSETKRYASEIVSIYRDVWLDTYTNSDLDISRDDLAERFVDFGDIVKNWEENILQDENRGYWVLKDAKNNIDGFCIAKKGEEENELEYIYLLQTAQGRGQGRALMNRALEWMGNVKPIILYGAAYNEKAIHFYEKFGFKLSNERISPKMLPNGKEIPSMMMVKIFD